MTIRRLLGAATIAALVSTPATALEQHVARQAWQAGRGIDESQYENVLSSPEKADYVFTAQGASRKPATGEPLYDISWRVSALDDERPLLEKYFILPRKATHVVTGTFTRGERSVTTYAAVSMQEGVAVGTPLGYQTPDGQFRTTSGDVQRDVDTTLGFKGSHSYTIIMPPEGQ